VPAARRGEEGEEVRGGGRAAGLPDREWEAERRRSQRGHGPTRGCACFPLPGGDGPRLRPGPSRPVPLVFWIPRAFSFGRALPGVRAVTPSSLSSFPALALHACVQALPPPAHSLFCLGPSRVLSLSLSLLLPSPSCLHPVPAPLLSLPAPVPVSFPVPFSVPVPMPVPLALLPCPVPVPILSLSLSLCELAHRLWRPRALSCPPSLLISPVPTGLLTVMSPSRVRPPLPHDALPVLGAVPHRIPRWAPGRVSL